MRKTVVKKTVSLRPDVWEYIEAHAGGNASGFINEAVRDYRRRQMRTQLIAGYKSMASRPQMAEDLALWDTTLLDGLNDEDNPSR